MEPNKLNISSGMDDFVLSSSAPNKSKCKKDDLIFCEICKEDITSMDVFNRSVHVNKCIDSSDSVPASVQPSGTSSSLILDCPLCFKTFSATELRSNHIKKCGKSKGLSVQSIIQAVELQEKHALERVSLGLPLKSVRQVKAPKKNNSKPITEPKSKMQSDLHLAKALSLSLTDEEKNTQDNNFFSLSAPQSHQNPGKPLKKCIRKVTQLLLQTEDERQKILQNKVTAIITPEMCDNEDGSLPVVAGSRKTDPNNVPVLWQLSGRASAKEKYYVDLLENWIKQSKSLSAPKLLSLSQVAGYEINTQIAPDYTFSSSQPDKSPSLMDCMKSLVNNPWMSDVNVMTSNNDIIPVHKLIILLRCPLVEQELEYLDNKQVLRWKNTAFDAALQFLNFVYTESIELNDDIISDVTYLAQKYKLDKLLLELEERDNMNSGLKFKENVLGFKKQNEIFTTEEKEDDEVLEERCDSLLTQQSENQDLELVFHYINSDTQCSSLKNNNVSLNPFNQEPSLQSHENDSGISKISNIFNSNSMLESKDCDLSMVSSESKDKYLSNAHESSRSKLDDACILIESEDESSSGFVNEGNECGQLSSSHNEISFSQIKMLAPTSGILSDADSEPAALNEECNDLVALPIEKCLDNNLSFSSKMVDIPNNEEDENISSPEVVYETQARRSENDLAYSDISEIPNISEKQQDACNVVSSQSIKSSESNFSNKLNDLIESRNEMSKEDVLNMYSGSPVAINNKEIFALGSSSQNFNSFISVSEVSVTLKNNVLGSPIIENAEKTSHLNDYSTDQSSPKESTLRNCSLDFKNLASGKENSSTSVFLESAELPVIDLSVNEKLSELQEQNIISVVSIKDTEMHVPESPPFNVSLSQSTSRTLVENIFVNPSTEENSNLFKFSHLSLDLEDKSNKNEFRNANLDLKTSNSIEDDYPAPASFESEKLPPVFLSSDEEANIQEEMQDYDKLLLSPSSSLDSGDIFSSDDENFIVAADPNKEVVNQPAVAVTPPTNANTAVVKYSDSPVTPFPDYNTMVTPDIKQALRKIGVKNLPRKKAVDLLSHIYNETHPLYNEEGDVVPQPVHSQLAKKEKTKSKKRKHSDDAVGKISKNKTTHNFADKHPFQGSSQMYENDRIPDSQGSSPKFKEIEDYILSNDALYEKILSYVPLNLVDFQKELKNNGISVGIQPLTDFLDEQCIVFTCPRNEGYRKKQTARTQKFRKTQIAKIKLSQKTDQLT